MLIFLTLKWSLLKTLYYTEIEEHLGKAKTPSFAEQASAVKNIAH